MLFNSPAYLIFLPVVFALYWFAFGKSFKIQNLVIIISSYVFYGWWDWRFLSLIFLSTIVDYFSGIKIYNTAKQTEKRIYLGISIIFNLGLLGFFKYYNFFVDSWIDLVSFLGYQIQSTWTLEIILPVGISFYTFQTISYSLDIYYKRLKPTKDFISFATFVAFFPQLVAGPIERASNLLPQLLANRIFNYTQGVQGLRLILWGMFKKVVIADSLAWRVNYCFDNYLILDGGTLFLGLFYFSIQIYCDFSGYSDIAIGTAKLFGIELRSNFRFPFFSKSILEFWRRWHISLSSWFRDYIYIPLGGSIKGKLLAIRNVFIVFIISGLWHGSNWTFIAWGSINALFYIPTLIIDRNRYFKINTENSCLLFSSFIKLYKILQTYILTTFTWVFFRSESLSISINYIFMMFSKFSIPSDNRGGIFLMIIFFILEWSNRLDERNVICYKNVYLRRLVYFILFYWCFAFFKFYDSNQFIYFAF